MNCTPELMAFVARHFDDDTDRLLLSAHRYPEIEMREAVEQIEARRQIRNKLPEWFALDQLVYGGRIPAEQCSSEQTARYKHSLVEGNSLCDLTGGMGVDFYYMTQGLQSAVYTERQPHLVEAMKHNLEVLYGQKPRPQFELRQGDGRSLVLPYVDTIYLDPARRGVDGSRVYDLEDCEPNVVTWQDELLAHCRKLIVKISPMADLKRVLEQLHGVSDLHVVAVRNECKEVIVEMSASAVGEVKVHCVDFRSYDTVKYDFLWSEESESTACVLQGDMGPYLYEPDVSLLKAGAFKRICRDFQVEKLESNSHYYASHHLVHDFPGRVFEVEEVMPFSSKLMKQLKKNVMQANISARNFPLTAEQLRARTGIRDGGSVCLIATTIARLGAAVIRCHKAVMMLVLAFLMCFVTEGLYAAGSRHRKQVQEETLASLLKNIPDKSPYEWHTGIQFVYMNHEMSPLLVPESPVADESLDYKGSVWTFDAIVSEEDWMGQQKMQLRFCSPEGRAYRFDTERLMSRASDTTYRPALGVLQSLEVIAAADSLLRARSLYILINDDRIDYADTLTLEKFVPVVIDSVTVGTEIAPLRVWFTQGEHHASFLTSLPGSREQATSTSIDRFLSVSDPYLKHSNISAEVWRLIRKNLIRVDMTTEEVRLSLGRPLRFERINTKRGLAERWYYPNSRVLEFWDGRLHSLSIIP